MLRQDMLCKKCGSVLSAVTFTCVRGEFCKAPVDPFALAVPAWHPHQMISQLGLENMAYEPDEVN